MMHLQRNRETGIPEAGPVAIIEVVSRCMILRYVFLELGWELKLMIRGDTMVIMNPAEDKEAGGLCQKPIFSVICAVSYIGQFCLHYRKLMWISDKLQQQRYIQ